jgi:asparagine N-glycosylation enzyme membrane subunit Stt3
MWTKENTPEDAVIIFWWDYGYYFQAVAERRTVADGGGNVPRNIVLANMFTSPEEEALKYIRRFVDYERVPTYMLVSYEEFGKSGAINRIAAGDPDNPSRIKSTDGQLYIDNFRLRKSGSKEQDEANLIEIFTRYRISTYYIVDLGKEYLVWYLIQVDENGNYHPEWAEKLLVKLLPFNVGLGKGLKHFELVYSDPWGYIFIYRVK